MLWFTKTIKVSRILNKHRMLSFFQMYIEDNLRQFI